MNATANLSIIISFALHMKKHVKSQDQIDSIPNFYRFFNVL